MSNTRNVLNIKPLRFYEPDMSMYGRGVIADYTPGLPANLIDNQNYSKITKYKTKSFPSLSENAIFNEGQHSARVSQLSVCKEQVNLLNPICNFSKPVNFIDTFPIKRELYIPNVNQGGIVTKKMNVKKFVKCSSK